MCVEPQDLRTGAAGGVLGRRHIPWGGVAPGQRKKKELWGYSHPRISH